MRTASLWKRLLDAEQTVVEDVEFDEDADAVIACVRPRKRARYRCGRGWRGLDLGPVKVFLEAEAPRVACPKHRPTVIEVPWARHGAPDAGV